jgi:hypothetical protein
LRSLGSGRCLGNGGVLSVWVKDRGVLDGAALLEKLAQLVLVGFVRDATYEDVGVGWELRGLLAYGGLLFLFLLFELFEASRNISLVLSFFLLLLLPYHLLFFNFHHRLFNLLQLFRFDHYLILLLFLLLFLLMLLRHEITNPIIMLNS